MALAQVSQLAVAGWAGLYGGDPTGRTQGKKKLFNAWTRLRKKLKKNLMPLPMPHLLANMYLVSILCSAPWPPPLTTGVTREKG